MKAIGVTTFGGPEVLHVFELPEPHADAGEEQAYRQAITTTEEQVDSLTGTGHLLERYAS